jgi:uncharacterized protein YgbK (DUF1537 family)
LTWLAILADDFTGACDAAGAFAATRATLVVLGVPARWPAAAAGVEVLSVDLDLRERSTAEGESLTSEATRRLCSGKAPPQVFLKIDSTLRGPIAGLVTGALTGSARPIAVIAPAFPEQGRLLREGRLVSDGRPGASLVQALGLERTALLGASFAHSAEEVEVAVEHARTRGARHVVVDADTVEDLRSVAGAWARHPEWLLVGSAGLARQVAGTSNRAHQATTSSPGPVLVVAGSPAPATQMQLEQLRDLGPTVLVDRESVAPRRPSGDHAALILCTPAQTVGERDLGERARTAAEVVATWAAEFRPGWLVLTGGATARAVCERLGAHGVCLQGELEPGIPTGYLVGGIWDGVRVVTKAGGFGRPDTLLDVVQALGVSSIAERTHE